MRPVNLLPQGDRASRPAEGLGGSAYVVLGVLGVLLIAVAAFVFTQNQVNDRSSQIAKAAAEAQQAEQLVASLGAFGSFASVKQQREESVRELAKTRFDWERFMRELALVLPSGTSLLDATASTNAEGAAASSSTPAPAPSAAAGAATAAPGSPTVKLVGCAVSQPRVATLLVRLRKLAGATEVTLTESVEEEGGATAGGGADTAAASNTTCPKGKFKFDVLVTFAGADEAAAEIKPRKTPNRLGGGA